MAVFRKIETRFWSDSFVESLTPEQKYFYLYLMTNEKTTQCGIYECTIRKMSVDTGYNQDTIQKLIDFFSNQGKIKYSEKTNEICLINWLKYNSSTSHTVQKCIDNELEKVKDRVLIEYLYSIDTHSQKEEEKEEEKEEVKKNKDEELFLILNEYSYSEKRIELIKTWIRYKREKKQKYTETGFRLLLKKNDSYSDEEFELMVDNSIANNYSGLFEVKSKTLNTQYSKQYNSAGEVPPNRAGYIAVPDDF